MRLFVCDYQFLSCGAVFTDGLAHAAAELGLEYDHALWNAPNVMARIHAFKPDLFFVTHGRKFCRTYRGQRIPSPSAIWCLDEPYEVDDVSAFSREFSYVFLCDPGTLHRHPRSSYLPVCYDPAVYYDDPAVSRTAAVGFIGGANPVRNTYLTALARRSLLTYVVGGAFCEEVQRLSRGHNIPAVMTADWYRKTQIIVNVFRSEHHYNRERIPATSANPRVYEATACGALVVSEWRPELDRICPEMPTFRSPEECVEKVAALLADPSLLESTRQACVARLKPHTYASRLRTVLETCGLLAGVAA